MSSAAREAHMERSGGVCWTVRRAAEDGAPTGIVYIFGVGADIIRPAFYRQPPHQFRFAQQLPP